MHRDTRGGPLARCCCSRAPWPVSGSWPLAVHATLGEALTLGCSLTFLRFIHAVACLSAHFFFMAKQHPLVWRDHVLVICSSADRHLDYVHLSAITNSTAKIIRACVSV